MKIALTGAGGTGKTTLAKALARELKEPYIPGVMRELLASAGITEEAQYAMSDEDRFQLQLQGFTAKTAQDSGVVSGVADRTLLDHLAYAVTRCPTQLTQPTVKCLMGVVNNSLAAYDWIIYCPLYDWTPEGDGLRDLKYGPRLVLDMFIRGYLDSQLGLANLIILSDRDVEARLTEVLDQIYK